MTKLICTLMLVGTPLFLQTGCDELEDLGFDVIYYGDSSCCDGGYYYEDVYVDEYWYEEEYWYEDTYYEDTWYDDWFFWP